jgi:protoporphyrinogen oxidase
LIKSQGGKVELDIHIEKATVDNQKIKSFESTDGRKFEADFVFWTGDLHDLEKLLCLESSQLNYCSTVLCNLLVEGTPPVPSQWEYFGSSTIIFCRTSINICFNPRLAPKGYHGICAEILCYEDDFVWTQAETLLSSLIQNLIQAKIVRNFNSIKEVHFERVKNTYPIYQLDYLTHLEKYTDKIKSFKNILACGRTGCFWYNNMDHSIRSAIDIASMIDFDKYSDTLTLPVKGVYRGNF